MIGSHRLRQIVACGQHPRLLMDLASEVLAARELQRSIKDYFEFARVRVSRDTSSFTSAVHNSLESLAKTQNDQLG